MVRRDLLDLILRGCEYISDLILRSGVGVYHRAALRADPLAASRRMTASPFTARWFETRGFAALLTMRV
jgi:hypothetical protein